MNFWNPQFVELLYKLDKEEEQNQYVNYTKEELILEITKLKKKNDNNLIKIDSLKKEIKNLSTSKE